ncbi:MAG: tRNA (cytidine(34)-2'-O)-methyltransferase [Proteobacteria bacterium]|nr:tRNA (cytidine(34)-2'-O)-methyltransferase [Pseudomonadota bacterium]
MSKIVLYQPEIAGNVGAIIRTCVCFDVELHIVEPCGFPLDMQRVKRAAMDYISHVKIFRHTSFEDFFRDEILQKNQRLILATTKAKDDYREFQFQESDVIIFGKESSGVPDDVAKSAHHKIFIPMKNQMRSLNIAIACGIILARSV